MYGSISWTAPSVYPATVTIKAALRFSARTVTVVCPSLTPVITAPPDSSCTCIFSALNSQISFTSFLTEDGVMLTATCAISPTLTVICCFPKDRLGFIHAVVKANKRIHCTVQEYTDARRDIERRERKERKKAEMEAKKGAK